MPRSKRAQWGWFRLDRRWANEIVRTSHITSRDVVLDIGAGTGALTAPLAATGARVIAFELNTDRVVILRERFHDVPNVKVVNADARDLRLPRRPFRVVANPPFSITDDLLQRLLHPRTHLLCAYLVLQLQVARRLANGDIRRYISARASFDFEISRRLPRSAFCPRPAVDTAVLHICRMHISHESAKRR